nr:MULTISPECIES: helix-turn-helix domain-containing protein [unclassified Parabacteroides]
MNMWTEMSNPAILLKIGSRIRETRIRQDKTQAELALASGVTPLTVANIEKGKSVSTLILISVLRELGLLENLENLVPEAKISPLQLKKIQGKKRSRVRRLKSNDNE